MVSPCFVSCSQSQGIGSKSSIISLPPSHGKGAVDGVGGTVKRQVRAEVMTRKEVINNAEKYSVVAKKCCPGIDVVYLDKQKVQSMIPQLDKFFLNTRALSGTRRMHYIEVTGPGEVFS